ncbi:hypothetical protein A1O9_01508 [Neofusicoccum parvum]|uniref:Uncharacterized protein n=1 Tax=Neofusicoccum parvum TaxID=310453 RepID=A0ACB5RV01_9PEZI|nr:hypothetical protein A1O9_01508 [Neofusicoccum parvum]
MEGVSRVAVSLQFNQATLAYDESKVSLDAIVRAIEQLGYEAKPGGRSLQETLQMLQHRDELATLQHTLRGVLLYTALIALTTLLHRTGLLTHALGPAPAARVTATLTLLLSTLLQAHPARPIHASGLRALLSLHPTTHTLTSLTQLLSLAVSAPSLLRAPSLPTPLPSTTALLAILLATRTLTLRLRRAAAATLTALFRLRAASALVRVRVDNDGTETLLPAALLRPRDRVTVAAFTSVPADGVVVGGASRVSAAQLTGEAGGVAVGVGDTVAGGSENWEGELGVVVLRGVEESAVGRVLGSGVCVYIGLNGQFVGRLVLQDTPRPEANEVIQDLKASGLTLTMLTGDSAHEAHRISKLLSIPVLASGALPGDKRAFVAELQAQGHVVAMVGDGINDAPALAAADVGIQLSLPRGGGGGAADGSPGAGSVLLTRQDLRYLPRMFRMARLTVRQARRNVVWTLVYNVFSLLFAVGAFERWGWKADA